MTQADSTSVLRRSLEPEPILPGPGSATIKTPLPDGWAYFCSKPDAGVTSHWYATPPWNVQKLKDKHGKDAWGLEHTVVGTTWRALHVAVADQMLLYFGLGEN